MFVKRSSVCLCLINLHCGAFTMLHKMIGLDQLIIALMAKTNISHLKLGLNKHKHIHTYTLKYVYITSSLTHNQYFSQTMPSAISGAPHAHIPSNEECGIRDVWKQNLEEEFRTIRKVVQKYHYVAMDTEFPGVVARPVGEFRSTADYHYQLLRCNVDLLRIINWALPSWTTMERHHPATPPGSSTSSLT